MWGDFHVIGIYDGTSFKVTESGSPQRPDSGDDDVIDTPCPEPEGGWRVPDPSRASQAHASRAAQLAEREPGFSGVWVDYYGPTDPDAQSDAEAYGDIILNAAFTGDLEGREETLRDVWGGALCVVEAQHTYKELRAIQKEAAQVGEEEFGLEVLWSDADVTTGRVEIGVVVIDAETRAALDERYGPGIVKVTPSLRPVE